MNRASPLSGRQPSGPSGSPLRLAQSKVRVIKGGEFRLIALFYWERSDIIKGGEKP